MKKRCDRIFNIVNHNPCVGKFYRHQKQNKKKTTTKQIEHQQLQQLQQLLQLQQQVQQHDKLSKRDKKIKTNIYRKFVEYLKLML